MKRLEQQTPASKQQRGIVLLITLLALVAMTLASVGMMRSVDTSVMAVSNMAFRQSADAVVNQGIECFIRGDARVWANALAANPNHLDANGAGGAYYYAALQPGEDDYGIPDLLRTGGGSACCPGGLDSDTGNTAWCVVERMCNDVGTADQDKCLGTSALACDSPNATGEFGEVCFEGGGFSAFYRMSVRVDGPRNTTSFSQVILNF
ncbi:MAG: hypothetical protein LBE75_07150 [Burkholderiales bacterium]|jgi:hypothetical protein|nr:hypothetical protein [Burkholderiales bacterium]